jgi:hypothetical protein
LDLTLTATRNGIRQNKPTGTEAQKSQRRFSRSNENLLVLMYGRILKKINPNP